MRSDDEQVNEIEELREQLAAANALLERIFNWHGPHGLTVTVMNDIRAHLAAQPATAPAGCEEEDGSPCDVCGETCAWGSRHVQCRHATAPASADFCAACMSPNGFCLCPSERTAPDRIEAKT